MQGKNVNLYGTDGIRLTRCGYTGEDGFELSVPTDQGKEITPTLSGFQISYDAIRFLFCKPFLSSKFC